MKFLKKPYISQELAVFLAALVLVFAVRECSSENELPVYQPSYLNPALVDVSKRAVVRDHRVAEFKLINQDGDTITQNDYNNHIYVADFFFTRCPSICPIMTNNMAKLQAR
ncbi:MAG TPA: SCO family protein, partial [Eudoraea sp.]|nr:SCO family protein [Eudoraea sp.]